MRVVHDNRVLYALKTADSSRISLYEGSPFYDYTADALGFRTRDGEGWRKRKDVEGSSVSAVLSPIGTEAPVLGIRNPNFPTARTLNFGPTRGGLEVFLKATSSFAVDACRSQPARACCTPRVAATTEPRRLRRRRRWSTRRRCGAMWAARCPPSKPLLKPASWL